jgi:ABC-2 type transport system permease protein
MRRLRGRLLRLWHLLRLIALFWRTSWAAEVEYRSNFVFAALSSGGTLVASGFSLWLFYRGGAGFPGWSLDESLVVLGLSSVFTGLVGALLAPNLGRIVTHVEQGTLDFVLLKPVDPQLQLSLRVLSPWGLVDIAFGAALVVAGLVRAGVGLRAVLAVVPLLSGVILLYGLWFLVATTAVWFTKIYNATEVLRGLLDAGRFPLAAYPAAYRVFFTWVVPVAFLTTVPAEALLGRASTTLLVAGPAVAGLVFVVARRFWLRALRSYSGATG